MRTSIRAILCAAGIAAVLVGTPGTVLAGTPPQVYSVIEGRDTGTDRPVLVLVGKSLTKFTAFRLVDPDGVRPPEDLATVLRGKTMLVLGVSADAPPGWYDLVGTFGAEETRTFRVCVTNEAPLPGAVADASLDPALRSDLDDAATLGGNAPPFYRDATNLDAGTLSPDRFSAYGDLVAEAKVGEGAAQVAAGDHGHDAVYPKKTDLALAGTLNDAGNPVDWTRLKGVPADLADGTDDNIWTEASGNAYRSSGKVGIGTASPSADLHVSGVDGALFGGTYDSGEIPATGAGVRMMWYPKKAAFRAGRAWSAEWDDGSVGNYSVAMGFLTTASGYASTAMGVGLTASGYSSTAFGNSSTASGDYSMAMGNSATASGYASTAMGYSTTASGNVSTATGESTRASGAGSTAMGSSTTASGVFSTALGYYTTAQAFGVLALGRHNVATGTTDSWVATDPVLVVGNGTSGASQANAFTLLKNGNLTIAGTLTENSDARLKQDIAPLTGVLGRLSGIRGVSYRFRDEERDPAGPQIGLLAQEVREAYPELVREDSRGTLSVSYGNFAAVLLEAVKEQQAVIEAQRKDLAAMEARLARLEARLERK